MIKTRFFLPMMISLCSSTIAFAAETDVKVNAYQEESRKVAMSFLKTLSGELKKEIEKNGPEQAVSVCKTLAPTMANQLSNQHGWRVTRVSLKVRNPLLGTPDAWEQKVLMNFDERVAKGEKPEKMEFSEVVQEPQGPVFRYMKAVGVQPVCLACHGQKEMPEKIKERLSKEYPHDHATGYQVGQIRGAVSIKRAVTP